MRKSSADIHDLIHTLTKAERKQVTLRIKSLGKQGEEYLSLFKHIDKQVTYDEPAIKRRLKTSSYSRLKKKLYTLILDSIASFQTEQEVYLELLQGLQHYHTLYQKELYAQAHKLIYQLKTLALNYHQLELLQYINMLIIKLECNVMGYEQYEVSSFNQLVDDIALHNDQVHNKQAYLILTAHFEFLLNKEKDFAKQKTALQALRAHPLLQTSERALSWAAKMHYHTVHLAMALYAEAHETACDHSLQVLDIYEQHFYPHAPNIDTYLAHHTNAIICATAAVKVDLCEQLFAKANHLLAELTVNISHSKMTVLGLQLNWYALIGDAPRGVELFEEHQAFIAQHQSTPHFIPLSISLAYLRINAQEYDLATEHLNDVIDHCDQLYYSLSEAAQLMRLVCYCEQEEWSLLASLSRSLYRKCQDDAALSEAKLILLRLFQKLARKAYSNEQIVDFFKKTKTALQVLQDEQPLALVQLCRHFDYFSWLDSRIQGCSLAHLLQTKAGLSVANLN